MKIDKFYINTYKYDFQVAKVCIASIRYWYPEIPIILIKDYGAGTFNTSGLEKKWNVRVFETTKRRFGWGYGKLEPLFEQQSVGFMVLDADTVLTGPVLEGIIDTKADFVVDQEVQPVERFNEIYYNLDRIREIDPSFRYPGYSFNSGQWFGTAGLLSRKDFEPGLVWGNPPSPRFPEIIFNGDQAILNFVLHQKEQTGKIIIEKRKLMIWPEAGRADFIDINSIRHRSKDYPFVIHWAGMTGMQLKNLSSLPRYDIIKFYKDYYYSKAGVITEMKDAVTGLWNYYERKIKFVLKKRSKKD